MPIGALKQAKLSYTNTLKRQGWTVDNLLKENEKSKWAPYIGNSSAAIVYSKTDTSCGAGHVTNFDYSKMVRAKALPGEDRVYGKGAKKRKFSARAQVEEFAFTVENGRSFEGCDVNDLSNKEHGDSVAILAQNYVISKDQMLFDCAQGGIGTEPTHIYDLGTSFEYNDLINLETAFKTGRGYKKADANGVVSTTAAKRRLPLRGFRTDGGEDMYLVFLDTYSANQLKLDPKYQTIVINADVRGTSNRSLNFVIGKLGKTYYVEMGDFVGETEGKGTFDYTDSLVEFSGLRKYAVLADGTKAWEGQEAYDTAYDAWEADKTGSGISIYSRNLGLGAGAMQFVMGKSPDYKWRPEPYDDEESESHMRVWMTGQKTILTLEAGEDSKKAPIAEIDFSVVAIDMKHS